MATLDEQYMQAVTEQRNYLAQLQEAFKKHCEEITAEAQQKIAIIPETNLPERQAAFEEQKKKLEEALNQLKSEMDKSMLMTRQKLEGIHTQREAQQLLELEALMTK
jgi:phenylalanyl-tRNA synthetase alpha subunit